MEQDRYKPATDIVMEIRDKFDTDIVWLLYGTEQHLMQNASEMEGLDNEIDLVLLFRKLKSYDQEEILEFIKLEIKRYSS